VVRAVTERLLLRLEWRVIRRLEGRVQGGYRTARQGSGFDLAGLRHYIEGDDARRIDWNVTARLGEPITRVFNEERELTVWLVLDCSASMAVGRPGRGKRDVLAELTLLLGMLFNRGGNRIGALLYDAAPGGKAGGARTRVVPPGSGRRHVLRIAVELERAAAGAARGAGAGRAGGAEAGGAEAGRGGLTGRGRRGGRARRAATGTTTDLAAMLETVAKFARRRSLIVVISDFIGDGDWTSPMSRLTRRHEVVALRVTDAADDQLPAAGLIVIEDAETGEQLIIDSGDPLLRARLDAGVTARDASIGAGMRQSGVPLHRIGTDSDLGRALIEVVSETRRRPG
jgi:uncharacterized protein (DUF58 family)